MYTCVCSSEWLHVHSLGQPHCWCCSWYTCTTGRGSWLTPVLFWNGCHCHQHAHLSQEWRSHCEIEVWHDVSMLTDGIKVVKFLLCFPLHLVSIPLPSPGRPLSPLSLPSLSHWRSSPFHSLPPQVISQPCYGGVNLFMNYLQKIGVEVTWVKENNIEQYKQAVKGNTKVMCTWPIENLF